MLHPNLPHALLLGLAGNPVQRLDLASIRAVDRHEGVGGLEVGDERDAAAKPGDPRPRLFGIGLVLVGEGDGENHGSGYGGDGRRREL